MISKEKVKDLCEKWWVATKQNEDMVIEQWLEQNQPAPVVVGLSDEQIDLLGCLLYPASKTFERARECYGYQNAIRDFLKTQTFAQPEPVVGLSDEQVGELAEVVAGVDNIARLENRIRGWLMTQKFAQLDLSNSQLIQTVLDMHNYQGLKDELEQLKSQPQPNWEDDVVSIQNGYITYDADNCTQWFEVGDMVYRPTKLHKSVEWGNVREGSFADYPRIKGEIKFQPNWDDAPDNAKWLTVSYLWSDENHKRIRTTIMSEHKRPKPTQQVEVGQVWKFINESYVVTGIERIKGKTKIGEEWVDGLELVNYHRGTNLISIEFQSYTRMMDEFTAKFERVI